MTSFVHRNKRNATNRMKTVFYIKQISNLPLSFILFTVIFSVICSSCAHEDISKRVDTSNKDISISSLIYNPTTRRFFKDSERKEYFTGIAVERNQAGKLTRLYEYENGSMSKAKIWTDFGGELRQTIDMEYRNHRAYNGWYTILVVSPNGEKTTTIYSYFKDGNKVGGWNFDRQNLQVLFAPYGQEKEVLFQAKNKTEFYQKLRSSLAEIKPEHFNMFADQQFVSSVGK